MVSRAGLEPATTALKDRNGLIARVWSRDFSVHYGNSVSVDCSRVRSVGHRLGHNGPNHARVVDAGPVLRAVTRVSTGVVLLEFFERPSSVTFAGITVVGSSASENCAERVNYDVWEICPPEVGVIEMTVRAPLPLSPRFSGAEHDELPSMYSAQAVASSGQRKQQLLGRIGTRTDSSHQWQPSGR